jgi:hypothetical protein
LEATQLLTNVGLEVAEDTLAIMRLLAAIGICYEMVPKPTGKVKNFLSLSHFLVCVFFYFVLSYTLYSSANLSLLFSLLQINFKKKSILSQIQIEQSD